MKGLGVAIIVKGIGFEGVWGELESEGGFRGQSVTGCLGLTLVFVWGSVAGRWATILWGLDTFLIFPDFLRSSVLSRSSTREVTRVCHVYK